jgi:gamma-D-glutamyl-L-lysine dipeptidyl-peptidase
MSTRIAAAVVTLAAADLRRRPDHRSELRSQLLMGETVRLLERTAGGQWWRVENHDDGYRGWVRSWGLSEVTVSGAARWRRRARGRARWLFTEVRERPGAGDVVTPLFWNGRVVPRERRGGWRRIELPDAREGWIDDAALAARGSRLALRTRLSGLMGSPYLWGGRTPLGFDCSGFVQQILAEQGFALPRDAEQQFRAGRRLRRGEEPRAGDLVFFGRRRGSLQHVGLLLDRNLYAHARGAVRINSLDPSSPAYDKALAAMVRGFTRPRRRPPARDTRGAHSG